MKFDESSKSKKKLMHKSLSVFLNHDWQKTLFIKGGWGTGKSTFIRHYFKTDEVGSGYPYAYTSISGISNVAELKRRILSGLLVADNGVFSKIDNRLRPFIWALFDNIEDIQNIAPKEIKPLNLRKISDQLLSPSFKTSSFVIVLDDIEKCKFENFDSVFSFFTFIKEATSCKLILIGNEDAQPGDESSTNKRLPEAINSNQGEWRDKIIDHQLDFNLSVDDIVSIFDANECLGTCLREYLERNTNRDLRKIKKAIDLAVNFSELDGTAFKQSVLKHSFEAAIENLEQDELKRPEKEFKPQSGNQILNECAIRFLRNGYLEEEESSHLVYAINDLRQRSKSDTVSTTIQKIHRLFLYSFASKDYIESLIVDVADQFENLTFMHACNFLLFLRAHQFNDSKYMDLINAKIAIIAKQVPVEEVNSIRRFVHDANFSALLNELVVIPPLASIVECIVWTRKDNTRALKSIEFLDSESAAEEIITSTDESFVRSLKEIYTDLDSYKQRGELMFENSKVKFDKILDIIAMSSEINAQRVDYVRHGN